MGTARPWGRHGHGVPADGHQALLSPAEAAGVGMLQQRPRCSWRCGRAGTVRSARHTPAPRRVPWLNPPPPPPVTRSRAAVAALQFAFQRRRQLCRNPGAAPPAALNINACPTLRGGTCRGRPPAPSPPPALTGRAAAPAPPGAVPEGAGGWGGLWWCQLCPSPWQGGTKRGRGAGGGSGARRAARSPPNPLPSPRGLGVTGGFAPPPLPYAAAEAVQLIASVPGGGGMWAALPPALGSSQKSRAEK